jgi:hypothetical protein
MFKKDSKGNITQLTTAEMANGNSKGISKGHSKGQSTVENYKMGNIGGNGGLYHGPQSKNLWLWIVLAVLVLAIIGGLVYYRK